MTEKSIKLKPCPFCGERANLFRRETPGSRRLVYMVECSNRACWVSVCTWHCDTKEEAAAVWNRRAE